MPRASLCVYFFFALSVCCCVVSCCADEPDGGKVDCVGLCGCDVFFCLSFRSVLYECLLFVSLKPYIATCMFPMKYPFYEEHPFWEFVVSTSFFPSYQQREPWCPHV